MNSLPKTVTRQRRGCDFNPDPSAHETPRVQHANYHSATEPPHIRLSLLCEIFSKILAQ